MAKSDGTDTHGSGDSKRGRRRSADDLEVDLGSDKLYFKIGEVAEIVGVAPYVLRYWETEFKAIRPQKSRAKQRVYRRRDVETLLRIKHLLYDKKFTIAGARQQLNEASETDEIAAPSGVYLAQQSFERVRRRLEELVALVEADELLDTASADPAAFVRSHGGIGSFAPSVGGSDASVIARAGRAGE
jgi:DNA-binding transcriptional MerR regulator